MVYIVRLNLPNNTAVLCGVLYMSVQIICRWHPSLSSSVGVQMCTDPILFSAMLLYMACNPYYYGISWLSVTCKASRFNSNSNRLCLPIARRSQMTQTIDGASW